MKQNINAVQSTIRTRKKVCKIRQHLPPATCSDTRKANQDAADLIQQKMDMETEMKGLEAAARDKDNALEKKLRTVGNYVHESVPYDNDEVFQML